MFERPFSPSLWMMEFIKKWCHVSQYLHHKALIKQGHRAHLGFLSYVWGFHMCMHTFTTVSMHSCDKAWEAEQKGHLCCVFSRPCDLTATLWCVIDCSRSMRAEVSVGKTKQKQRTSRLSRSAAHRNTTPRCWLWERRTKLLSADEQAKQWSVHQGGNVKQRWIDVCASARRTAPSVVWPGHVTHQKFVSDRFQTLCNDALQRPSLSRAVSLCIIYSWSEENVTWSPHQVSVFTSSFICDVITDCCTVLLIHSIVLLSFAPNCSYC